MATLTLESEQEAAPEDRVVRARHRAGHLSHEARTLMASAADALEDRVHDARRAIKSARRRAEEEIDDLKDDAIRRVKHHPMGAVGTMFGAGLAIGLATGWLMHCISKARQAARGISVS